VTFVFDGCTIGSTAFDIPSVRAGNFVAGSTIKIICINNTTWSAKGGDGGTFDGVYFNITNGKDGANSYQSDGIATEIYLNYGTIDTYETDAIMIASGGGGGAAAGFAGPLNSGRTATGGGGGGAGIPFGMGGLSFSSNNSKTDGGDGTLTDGGEGGTGVAFYTESQQFTALGGGGGDSGVNGQDGQNGVLWVPTLGGLGGGSIKGTNVTVYNLAADSSKFIAGNSDAFTLITV